MWQGLRDARAVGPEFHQNSHDFVCVIPVRARAVDM
jgi:hypothetical protein